MANNTPDLTQYPPRSPRVRLGGFAILPRMLDKGRATLAGKNGEYHYNCPLDERFTEFVGIEAVALQRQLAADKSDNEILKWIIENSTTKPSPTEITAWSALQEQRVPTNPDSRNHFNEIHSKVAPHREDIGTWFDLLDVDDYVSFGGKA